MSDRFSNGDENEVELLVRNGYTFPVRLEIVDELPFQFQLRNFSLKGSLKAREEKQYKYRLRPVERGEYQFGNVQLYVRSAFGLVTRRYTEALEKTVKVYPSFMQLRDYELFSIKHKS